jgi:hypothetical protein
MMGVTNNLVALEGLRIAQASGISYLRDRVEGGL